MGIGVSSNQVEQTASHIGCLTFTPPFCYLGVKVGGMMSRISTWNEVIQRLLDQLSKWKMKMLSTGGRLTLLKSVLGSMPIYHMSLFKTPMKVLNTMESIRGKFFNGMELNEKKMVWVRWSNVLSSKQKGGLAIHGNDGHLISMPKVSRSSIWLDIVREVFHLKQQGDCPLKDQYPRLYNLEVNKNVSVANKIGSNNFCDSFRRLPRGGAESEQFNELSSKLSCVRLDKLPTRLNLSLRGLDIESVLCPLCDSYVETSSHLLFACSLVKSLAHKIMIWWDINLMDFGSYEEWLPWFLGLKIRGKQKEVLEGVAQGRRR
ncbi:RNA-directed DNA polymerase, eukaryota, reverse transcriptase zinc-binding domain protein [Tanacetum coccineum]